MSFRSIPRNLRIRAGLDTDIWNKMWGDLADDMEDIAGSGADPMYLMDLGEDDLIDDYDAAVSGIAGKIV